MAEPIKCPLCAEGEPCDHDQDERRELCRVMGVAETPEPTAYDSSDPSQVQQRKRKAKSAIAREDEDLRWLMRQPQGRRFIWRLFERTGMFRTSVNPQAPSELMTFFAEGQRNVGLVYLNDVHRVAMPEYLLMLQERDGSHAS